MKGHQKIITAIREFGRHVLTIFVKILEARRKVMVTSKYVWLIFKEHLEYAYGRLPFAMSFDIFWSITARRNIPFTNRRVIIFDFVLKRVID